MREWWLQTAYLGYRAPVIVNSSPGIVGPPITFKKSDDFYVCAARLVAGVCDYNQNVKRFVIFIVFSYLEFVCMIYATL